MAKTLGRIKNGTVIDHIAAKKAVKVLKALRLDKARSVVSLAMNVKSKKMKKNPPMTEMRARTKAIIKTESKVSLKYKNGQGINPHDTVVRRIATVFAFFLIEIKEIINKITDIVLKIIKEIRSSIIKILNY